MTTILWIGLSIGVLSVLCAFGGFCYSRGFDSAERIWKPSSIFSGALWKREYIRLFKETYPNVKTTVELTAEEQKVLDDYYASKLP